MRLPTSKVIIAIAFLTAVLGPAYAHPGHAHTASLLSMLLPTALIAIAVLTLVASNRVRAHRTAWHIIGIASTSGGLWLLFGA